MKYRLSRRDFLRHFSLGAGALAFGGLRAAGQPADTAPRPPANDRITLGFIGLGAEGYGKNLQAFLAEADAQVVSVCDVYQESLDRAKGAVEQAYAAEAKNGVYKGCHATRDWREVIARPDIDAIIVSTPDHWHVPIALSAVIAGKDIFVEKPLSRTIEEGQVLAAAVDRFSRVSLTASEYGRSQLYHRAAELVRNGHIGKLHTVKVNVYAGYGMEEHAINPPIDPVPPPPGFDYDMWLGPAPEAPYTYARCGQRFRYIFDYAGGNLTDWGGHIFAAAQWGADKQTTDPIRVSGTGELPTTGLFNVATQFNLEYEYADGLKMICASGGYQVRFEGSDGWVEIDSANIRTSSPELQRIPSSANPIRIPLETVSEHRNFLDAVYGRWPTYAPVRNGHHTALLSHLGNIVLRLGRAVEWDSGKQVIVGDEMANRLRSQPMRAPWGLPTVV